MPPRRKKVPELKVVFDTNVLFTGSASDFLRHEIVDVIRSNSAHEDLSLQWYVPEVVMHERQFQMRRRGFELLPSLEKMERLLGHNLNITKDIVEDRVRSAIDRQAQELGVKLQPLDVSAVEWTKLILDALYRKPPFEAGEKEKGFRDALVAETFFQIVAQSPSTPKLCRVALITDDKLLTDAVNTRATGMSNVRVLSDADELKGLINTLVSEVSEEFVASIKKQATEYFFVPKLEDTLYYRENIRDKILEPFALRLREVPKGASHRANEGWTISAPQFVKKEGQRVTWATRITIAAKAYKSTTSVYLDHYLPASAAVKLPAGDVGNITTFPSFPSGSKPADANLLANSYLTLRDEYLSLANWELPAGISGESLAASGRSVFQVTWSVSVSTNLRFTNPKIERVEFIETVWE
jgi:PIN domain